MMVKCLQDLADFKMINHVIWQMGDNNDNLSRPINAQKDVTLVLTEKKNLEALK